MSHMIYTDERSPSRLAVLSVVMFGVVSCMAGALFWTSQTANDYEERIGQMNRSLLNERQAIRILDAEWAYLTSPQRIEELVAMRNEMIAKTPAAAPSAVKVVQAATMVEVEAPVKKEEPVKLAEVKDMPKVQASAVKPVPARVERVAKVDAPVKAPEKTPVKAPVAAQNAIDVWPIERVRKAAPVVQRSHELYRPASLQGRAGMRPIVE